MLLYLTTQVRQLALLLTKARSWRFILSHAQAFLCHQSQVPSGLTALLLPVGSLRDDVHRHPAVHSAVPADPVPLPSISRAARSDSTAAAGGFTQG